MAFSVNSNAGAFAALQNLNLNGSDLATTKDRINSGSRADASKNNAENFAIAQTLRTEIAGLTEVTTSLDRAQSTLDIAIEAGASIAGILKELEDKAIAAQNTELASSSRNTLDNNFQQSRNQIISIIENAEFNGVNAIKNNGDAITATISEDGKNTITIAAQDLSLSGPNIVLGTDQDIATVSSASTAAANIATSIENVNKALSQFTSGANRIEIERDFINQLSDTVETGIGTLVNADLASETANLQALQVRQQLSVEALSIANQTPSTVLNLFK